MKNWKTLAITLAVLALPMAASAAGVEFAVGAWYVEPSGRIAYSPFGPNQYIGLNTTGIDNSWDFIFRLKAQPPSLPGIYLQAAPLSFSSTGERTDFQFDFGDVTFHPGDNVDADLYLNLYDAALYFPIPLIKTATLNVLSAEIGAGARWINYRTKLFAVSDDDSKSINVVYPQGYAAVRINPVERVVLEGEVWGYSYNSDKFWSLIGRLKIKPVGPLFISGGYREDYYDLSKDDLRLRDSHFKGPFGEVGLQW